MTEEVLKKLTMNLENSAPLVLDYLSQYTIINQTLFWQPLPKYRRHVLALRIEAELIRQKDCIGVEHLFYVGSEHSFQGLEAFFSDKPDSKHYLRFS